MTADKHCEVMLRRDHAIDEVRALDAYGVVYKRRLLPLASYIFSIFWVFWSA